MLQNLFDYIYTSKKYRITPYRIYDYKGEDFILENEDDQPGETRQSNKLIGEGRKVMRKTHKRRYVKIRKQRFHKKKIHKIFDIYDSKEYLSMKNKLVKQMKPDHKLNIRKKYKDVHQVLLEQILHAQNEKLKDLLYKRKGEITKKLEAGPSEEKKYKYEQQLIKINAELVRLKSGKMENMPTRVFKNLKEKEVGNLSVYSVNPSAQNKKQEGKKQEEGKDEDQSQQLSVVQEGNSPYGEIWKQQEKDKEYKQIMGPYKPYSKMEQQINEREKIFTFQNLGISFDQIRYYEMLKQNMIDHKKQANKPYDKIAYASQDTGKKTQTLQQQAQSKKDEFLQNVGVKESAAKQKIIQNRKEREAKLWKVREQRDEEYTQAQKQRRQKRNIIDEQMKKIYHDEEKKEEYNKLKAQLAEQLNIDTKIKKALKKRNEEITQQENEEDEKIYENEEKELQKLGVGVACETESGMSLRELINLIQNEIDIYDLDYEIQYITHGSADIKEAVGNGLIVIFLKNNHFRVMIYEKIPRNQIVYFDSLADRADLNADMPQIKRFVEEQCPQLMVKFKHNSNKWQNDDKIYKILGYASDFDNTFCGFYVYLFVQNYIKGMDFKEASHYNENNLKQIKNHVSNGFGFI